MENKIQMIHIVTNVVVISALTFYVHKVNSRLNEKIAFLTERLEKQEALIHQHDAFIQRWIQSSHSMYPTQPLSHVSAQPICEDGVCSLPMQEPSPRKTRKHWSPLKSSNDTHQAQQYPKEQFENSMPVQKTNTSLESTSCTDNSASLENYPEQENVISKNTDHSRSEDNDSVDSQDNNNEIDRVDSENDNDIEDEIAEEVNELSSHQT